MRKAQLTGSKTGGRSGQSLLELAVAIGLATAVVGGAVAFIWLGRSLTLDTELQNQALAVARQNLESAQATGQNNFSALASSSSTQDIFLKEISVQSLDAYTKKVISRVSWQTDPLRPQKVELTTLVTDAPTAQKLGGDTGGGGLTGDWLHPRTLGTIDLGPGNAATGLDVLNKIVYMSAIAADPKKPDFFIIDATDSQNPLTVSSLNTGPGLNAVDAAGSYVYAANNENDGQLQIISISNRSNPVLVSSYKLPGVSGGGAVGQSIFYYDSKVYIGTKTATGPEFHIVDVTDPGNPVELGSLDVGADVNAVKVSGTTAYLATSDDNREVVAVNVSDPAHPVQIGSLNAAGGDDGRSLFLVGSTLYLGRASGANDFIIADASSPSAPAVWSSSNLGGVSVNGVYARDYLAFLGTSDSNAEFQIWNIANSSSPFLAVTYNFPQIATGIDYENNVVYVAVRSNDALRIVTAQ